MQSEKKRSPIYVMSDDEMDAMLSENKKSSLMDSLLDAATQKTTRFSSVRRKNQPVKDETSESNRIISSSDDLENDLVSLEEINLSDKKISLLSDGDWDSMMTEFDELSPIDDITYEDRMNYRRKQTGDKFDQMFNKEQSMLNDLLASLQKRSKLIDKKIDSMTAGRSTYGVSKNFADLLNASNSLESTKLSVIKELIGVKKTATDLRMKDQKMNPDEGEVEDRDTIADRFYKSIISGNSRDFIKSSMSQYDGGGNQFQGLNLSQPSSFINGPDLNESDADKYGYIKYETLNAQVCICRHEDGSMEFVAIDEDNNVIPDYELPSNNLIVNVSIKPGSQYGYDEYSRKYRVFDAEEINFNPVSQNDPYGNSSPELDDEPYDDVTNDDKYDMDEDDELEDADYYDDEIV